MPDPFGHVVGISLIVLVGLIALALCAGSVFEMVRIRARSSQEFDGRASTRKGMWHRAHA